MEGLIQLEAIFATILKAQLGIHQLVNMKILISITNYLKQIKQSKKWKLICDVDLPNHFQNLQSSQTCKATVHLHFKS